MHHLCPANGCSHRLQNQPVPLNELSPFRTEAKPSSHSKYLLQFQYQLENMSYYHGDIVYMLCLRN